MGRLSRDTKQPGPGPRQPRVPGDAVGGCPGPALCLRLRWLAGNAPSHLAFLFPKRLPVGVGTPMRTLSGAFAAPSVACCALFPHLALVWVCAVSPVCAQGHPFPRSPTQSRSLGRGTGPTAFSPIRMAARCPVVWACGTTVPRSRPSGLRPGPGLALHSNRHGSMWRLCAPTHCLLEPHATAEVRRRYGPGPFPPRRPVPHATIYTPFALQYKSAAPTHQ